MDRIVVVGPPGSGKTTLGRRLAERLGCPHVELDALWWEPNWTEAGAEVFRERAARFADTDRWVVDGNYGDEGAREVVWPRADAIVWLDQPRWVTVPRIVRRSFSRGLRRTELWSGNREPLRHAYRPDVIIRWGMKLHPRYNRRYEGLDADPGLAHVTWVRLRTPRAVRRWLAAIR